MVTLVNRAKMSTSTTGTGTITLGSAETGYQSFADAGVADGDVVRYVIEDGDNWEIGSGTYTASGTTLTRTVDESSNSDAALNLTGSAVVFITAAAGDVFQGELYSESYDGTSTKPNTSGTNTIAIGVNAYAPNEYSIAIGRNASTQGGASGIALGEGADARNAAATALGYDTYANAFRSTAIGVNGAGGGSQAIGSGVTTGKAAMALGGSYASGVDSLAAAIATNSSTYGATGSNSVAIGYQAKATASSSIAIGNSAIASSANQVALGGSGTTIKISGAYTLPTSDGTNGQVLTTDGSGAVTFADAGGGGGAFTVVSKPDAYTVGSSDLGKILVFTGSWNEYATLGSASTLGSGFYVTITNQSGSTHVINRSGSDIISPNGSSGETNYKLPSGASVTLISDGTSKWLIQSISPYLYAECNNNSGNLNPSASGTGAVALGRSASAGGSASFAAGGNSSFGGSNASGSGSVALGGSYASGSNSFAAAIANNTSSYGATGANSVAIGYQAKASSTDAIAIGDGAVASATNAIAMGKSASASRSNSIAIGFNAETSSGNYSTAIGGSYTRALAFLATAIGGSSNRAEGSYSFVGGGRDITVTGEFARAGGYYCKTDIYGKDIWASGRFSSQGDAQTGTIVLRSDTTDATAEALTSNNSTASTTNQVVIPTNAAYAFHGTIVAKQSGSANAAAWKVEGLIVNNGGTTTLTNSATTVISNTPSWGMALSADNTNNALAITVTGAASTNIRWVATIHTSEVTYA